MAGNGFKLVEIYGQFLEMAWNVCEWPEMAVHGWKLLDMAGNDCTCLYMSVECWNWLKMAKKRGW